MKYKRFGILIDCSANGVIKVEKIKFLIDQMKKMGYNYLEIGMDDVYRIDDEPYFGYLRGGYTKDELKEIDEYAYQNGIELAPCIQTLAHLTNLVKLPHYEEIVDVNNILLIDDPKTYELIEKMFKTLRECFRTDIVNIGMDEAHMVGLGKYLDQHGYTNRYELLLKHLNKVIEIAEKYGFNAHMWSDMFFRLNNHGEYYKKNVHIPPEICEKVPKNISICYWDYGEHELTEDWFDELFKQHEEFDREIWYAGGAWCWNGFAPQTNYTLKAMELAMKQVRNHNIENVFITLWGVDGNDCSYFSTINALYAIKQYSQGIFDQKTIKKGFKELFGLNFEDFDLLNLPNKNSHNPNGLIMENQCKSLLYNDVFLGIMDYNLSKVEHIPFDEYAKRLKTAVPKTKTYSYIFDMLYKLCNVLDLKAELGLKTRALYRNGDIKGLKKLLKVYDKTAKRIEIFKKAMKVYWMTDYKPFGWEVQEVRLSGLNGRVLDCKERIERYVKGIDKNIPELEEDIICYADWGLQYNLYRGLISVSEI